MINWEEWRKRTHLNISNIMNTLDDPDLSKYYDHLTDEYALEVILAVIVDQERLVYTGMLIELERIIDNLKLGTEKYETT